MCFKDLSLDADYALTLVSDPGFSVSRWLQNDIWGIFLVILSVGENWKKNRFGLCLYLVLFY